MIRPLARSWRGDLDTNFKKAGEDAMAKRRKRKSMDAKPGGTAAVCTQSASRQAPAAPRSGVDPAAGMVSRGTCLAGMFFTLLLGLFLGSLIPGMMDGGAGHGPAGVPQAESAAPPADDWRDRLPHLMREKLAEHEKKTVQDPGDAGAWAALGNLYFDAGRSGEAIDAYGRSLEINPRNPDVLTDLGIMYREAGQPERAIASFRQASSVDPAHQNALFNEGVVLYYDLGRRDEALAVWRKLVELNPEAIAPDGKKVGSLLIELAGGAGQAH